MAKYGFNNLAISFGGTDMTAYITDINDVNVQAILEDSTPAGVAWIQQLFTGMKQVADITIGGIYDDTATTGPNAVFNAAGTSATLLVTWGGTKTTSATALIKEFKRTPKVKALTRYAVTLTLSGTVTEA